MNGIIVQAIGFIGVLFFIISYQIKSNRALFLFQMIGCMLFIIQFFLLGAYTGALSLIVNIIRNIMLMKASDWKWVKTKAAMIVVLAMLAAVTVYTWTGPLSVLPFITGFVTTIGYWTDNAQKIRLSQLIGCPWLLAYDVIIGSWGGVLNESITLMSIIVSILRFGWKNMGSKDSRFNS